MRGEGTAHLRAVAYALENAPARVGVGPFIPKHKHGPPPEIPVERTLPVSRDVSIVAAALGGEGQIQSMDYKIATTPFWRRDPQSQPLREACGLFFVRALPNFSSSD